MLCSDHCEIGERSKANSYRVEHGVDILFGSWQMVELLWL